MLDDERQSMAEEELDGVSVFDPSKKTATSLDAATKGLEPVMETPRSRTWTCELVTVTPYELELPTMMIGCWNVDDDVDPLQSVSAELDTATAPRLMSQRVIPDLIPIN
jgi:hypothetical protein